jgi:hypothetical protein
MARSRPIGISFWHSCRCTCKRNAKKRLWPRINTDERG